MTTPVLDLYGDEFRSRPHEVLASLREQGWWAQSPVGPAVLRHEPVQTLLGMRQLRTPGVDFLALQGITDGPLVETMRSFLLNADGEDHQRLRRLVSKAFTVRRVRDFRPVVRSCADELIAAMAGTDRADFVAAFAEPYSLRMLCAFVGIPEGDSAQVNGWAHDVGLIFGLSVAEHAGRIEAAVHSLNLFIDELIEARRRAPGPDLLSALILAEESGELLDDAELRAMVITMLSAGQGTVQFQLSQAVATFLAYPEQWRLLADRPDLAANAAEEVVRFCPSALLGVPRIAKSDVELHGTVFPAGTCLLPITGSANRDKAVFPRAGTFDIRREPTAQLTFGGGIHYCLGAALARVELQEALPRLAAGLRELSAAGEAEWLAPTEAVYGPVRLPVSYLAVQT
ncbi:cytochrome P450 [Actinoplanes auranticolor]|uniref:cytochrome P450 n=1 Tax=Actinoplanes auranticolor TaxID=47988 RepID=UPI001BB445C7|nr:cytochrome P450 [Actinoplanes auranticolor]